MPVFPEDFWPLPDRIDAPRLVAWGAVLVLALLGVAALATGEAFVPVRRYWTVTGERALWQGWHYLGWAGFVWAAVLLAGAVSRWAQAARLLAIVLTVGVVSFTGWKILSGLYG